MSIRARFAALVQSPLRAALLRFLHAHRDQSVDVDVLMRTFGRMRLDVDNCLSELETFGLAGRDAGAGFRFIEPRDVETRALVERFLAEHVVPSREDQSAAVLRFREMLGRDEKMLVVFEWIRTAAKADIAVLILGPTGSGKEIVARMIHELSRRGSRHFQAVNCAAVPEPLFESEIFGHEKGAFTGAHDRRTGVFELAHRGTLFLDEIAEMQPATQVKLLRVLQERTFRRLGGRQEQTVDVRVIAATNVNPLEASRTGKLREDLFYRLNVFNIELPPLRDRRDDIPLLVQSFLNEFNRVNNKSVRAVDQDAMYVLEHYPWPGNIRELRNVIERATILAEGDFIEMKHLPASLVAKGEETLPTLTIAPGTTVDEAERRLILLTLEHCRNNKTRAAEVLGISLKTLHNKLNRMKEESGSRL
jgi:DNA-binding NtrC family response regulator